MLGASPSQVVAIKRAKEMGYYVITCDYLENNPGHQLADEYYNYISTTDKEAVLALAKTLQIDGVVCYGTDSAALTVAYVSEKLGFPSFSYNSVEILSNKDKFRSFLEKNNFNTPKSKGYSTIKEAFADFHSFKMPVMIKPVDSSGSRGVSMIDSIDFFLEKVEDALCFSRAKRFIIEEYIEKRGYQIGGDCFIVNGKLTFSRLVNFHFESTSMNPLFPAGISWPCNCSKSMQEKIHDEIQRLIDVLDLKTGALIFEVRVDPNGDIYIIDAGVQNHGIITKILKHKEGIDLAEYTIKAALGEDCSDLIMVEPSGYCAHYTITCENSELVRGIVFDQYFQRNNVVKYDKASLKFVGNLKSFEIIGTLLLEFPTKMEMLEKMDDMKSWIKVLQSEDSQSEDSLIDVSTNS
jgi:biotin carboxylase